LVSSVEAERRVKNQTHSALSDEEIKQKWPIEPVHFVATLLHPHFKKFGDDDLSQQMAVKYLTAMIEQRSLSSHDIDSSNFTFDSLTVNPSIFSPITNKSRKTFQHHPQLKSINGLNHHSHSVMKKFYNFGVGTRRCSPFYPQ
jgi:hypothetical protein